MDIIYVYDALVGCRGDESEIERVELEWFRFRSMEEWLDYRSDTVLLLLTMATAFLMLIAVAATAAILLLLPALWNQINVYLWTRLR